MAIFRAGTCAFIPFSFWKGDTARSKADNRQMVKEIIMAGWRMPGLSQSARKEFTTQAQAASNSLEPVVERGSLSDEPIYMPRQLAAINAQHDTLQQPGQKAKEAMNNALHFSWRNLLQSNVWLGKPRAVERQRMS